MSLKTKVSFRYDKDLKKPLYKKLNKDNITLTEFLNKCIISYLDDQIVFYVVENACEIEMKDKDRLTVLENRMNKVDRIFKEISLIIKSEIVD